MPTLAPHPPFDLLHVALAIAASVGPLAHAGPGAWTSGGPYGATTPALAVAPTTPATLYAGTWHGGVFVSTDAGTSWARGGRGLTNLAVTTVAVHPTSPATVYAGTESGLFVSVDGGATWTRILAAGAVRAVAIPPSSPSTLYGAAAGDSGILKSTDAGATWTSSSSGIADPDVTSLAIDPVTPSTIYAGDGHYNGRVFKSANSGGTWTQVWAGSGAAGWVNALAVDPADPATVYASVAEGAGVIKSTDGGVNWASAVIGLPNAGTRSLVVDPVAPATLYVVVGASDVFRSTDAGASWAPASLGLTRPAVTTLALDRTAHTTLYAGTSAGDIFRSTDSGGTWAPLAARVQAQIVNALAFQPVTGRLYAATDGDGILRSTDSGGTWAGANAGLAYPDDYFVQALALDPAAPATLYAGSARRLLKSTDSGDTWSEVSQSAETEIDVRVLAIDPLHPSTLYVAGRWSWTGLRKSTDAGATWSPTLPGITGAVRVLVFDPGQPQVLYVGAEGADSQEGGVFKSTDSGGSWAAASTGLTWRSVRALALDPANSQRLYAGTTWAGIFKSTDGGATWAPASTGLSRRIVNALAIDPGRPGVVYAGTAVPGDRASAPGGRVFRSTDFGSTWGPVDAGLPPTAAVQALALKAGAETTVFAGLRGGSVWQATPPPPALVKGDLDGDGRPDLVFRSTSSGERNQTWLMNGPARRLELPIVPDAAGAAWRIRGVDDFDGDGRNDLVFRKDDTGEVEFWPMNGAVRVGAPVPLRGGAVLDPGWDLSATGDLDGDGRPDLVWRNSSSGKIVIWTMDGPLKTGALVPQPGQAADGNWALVATGDYNDDGDSDFLWYNATSGRLVTWYMNRLWNYELGSLWRLVRASGQFTTPAMAGDGNWRVVASSDYSGNAVPGTPPLGSPDVVWRNENSANQVVWHMDFTSARVFGQFTNPAASTPALDWTIVGPR